MSGITSNSPFEEDDQPMSLNDLLKQLDHNDFHDLLRALALRSEKKAKLTSLMLIHRRILERLMWAWRRKAELSFYSERQGHVITATGAPFKETRIGTRPKGRVPKVEIKSSRTKEPAHDTKLPKPLKAPEPPIPSPRSASSGRVGIAEKSQAVVSKVNPKPDANAKLSSSISPKRIDPKSFRSPKAPVVRNQKDRSTSATKRDLNSSAVLDKSVRSERSKSPSVNIGTRLFLQAQELKQKKELLRQAYEPDYSFAPNLKPNESKKKLSGSVALNSSFSHPPAVSASVIEPAREPVLDRSTVDTRRSDYTVDNEPSLDELDDAIATIRSGLRTTDGSNESYQEEEKSSNRSTNSYAEEDIEQSIQHKLEAAMMRKMMESQGGDEDIVIKKIKTTMGKYS